VAIVTTANLRAQGLFFCVFIPGALLLLILLPLSFKVI
jgi:hypothetical protein